MWIDKTQKIDFKIQKQIFNNMLLFLSLTINAGKIQGMV